MEMERELAAESRPVMIDAASPILKEHTRPFSLLQGQSQMVMGVVLLHQLPGMVLTEELPLQRQDLRLTQTTEPTLRDAFHLPAHQF